MNEQFTIQDLEMLIAHQGKPAVSIYLPTQRIPTRIQAESLQFKNLLREAEERLGQFDLRGPTIREMLEPARQLIAEPDFWRYQKDGLAVFISEDSFLTYQVSITFETSLIVADTFHLKPLLPILTSDQIFYILALSQNQVRLLQATRFSVDDVTPESLPSDIQEILSEYVFDNQLQFHTSTGSPGTGRRDAIYHGAGGTTGDENKAKIREFFDRINEGLTTFLGDANAPLIFAGVEYLFPIYQEANTYPHLVELPIKGNPEQLSAEALQRQGWRLIEAQFTAQQAADVDRYHSLAGAGQTATDVEEVVPWADQGRVETLFVDRLALVWGEYDHENFKARIQKDSQPEHAPSGRDLTDLAAIYTLLRQGQVYLLSPEEMEMEFGADNRHRDNEGESQNPTPRPRVAAIYRYSLENGE